MRTEQEEMLRACRRVKNGEGQTNGAEDKEVQHLRTRKRENFQEDGMEKWHCTVAGNTAEHKL